MQEKIHILIQLAKEKMAGSRDTIHDLHHARHVVQYVERFAAGYDVTAEQKQALILAAWWHDVSRTLFPGTSLVLMPLVDDILSACMLWRHTIRYGLFGGVVGMAVRMILCKGLGTGAILTRLLMRKDKRILVDLLRDADLVDVIDTERVERILLLAETSKIHRFGYRFVIQWHIGMSHLSMRTRVARMYIVDMMRRLLAWMKEPHIYDWHIRQFGLAWVERTVKTILVFFGEVTEASVRV